LVPIPAAKAREFSKRLLKWYVHGRRRFAWRLPKRTAYDILVAEVLLRKTTVATVAQEYDAFLARYPFPGSLAAANLDDIRASIRRLGIANRARLLKVIAGRLVQDHGGRVPRSRNALLALPGVGPYAANAVLCFAYGENYPIVDTNVIRVMARVFSVRSSKARPHTDPKLWACARQLVASDRPVAYNRALLDFAAVVCRPREPLCPNCPMNRICDYARQSAHIEKSTDELGTKSEFRVGAPFAP
jgi:A/G-specific adenine glycosylase